MSEIETEKQRLPLWKKIKLAIMILVLAAAALYIPAKLLAVKFTNKGTQLYDEGKFEEAMVQYKRALRVYPWFKPARKQLDELEKHLRQERRQ